jgi:cell division protein FtsW
MTDQSLPPQFIDEEITPRPVRGSGQSVDWVVDSRPPAERKLTYWATLDKPLLMIVFMLLAMGLVMVFSATFDWSLAEFGSEVAVFMTHVRNVGIGLVSLFIFSMFDPRFVRRLAVLIILLAISFLIAVLLFGDVTFGARRALIDGRFQPGEFTELAMIIYMSAWLGSKNVRVRSVTYGLIPFVMLVGIVAFLVLRQPDISTTMVIVITSGLMFFLAGADIRQIFIALATFIGVVALLFQSLPGYAMARINSFLAGIYDLTEADYHIRQSIIAFFSGGWTGVGLGESRQKFLALPAPHTDSIFAVIGEELGVLGAAVVVFLYLAFAIRGFQISRKAPDTFGSLLAAGITLWVMTKALLNIAVMTALVPPTGLPLPFISFGGSSMVVMLTGVGLLLCIQRSTMIRQKTPERRTSIANYDRSRRDRRARVSRAGRSRGDAPTIP